MQMRDNFCPWPLLQRNEEVKVPIKKKVSPWRDHGGDANFCQQWMEIQQQGHMCSLLNNLSHENLLRCIRFAFFCLCVVSRLLLNSFKSNSNSLCIMLLKVRFGYCWPKKSCFLFFPPQTLAIPAISLVIFCEPRPLAISGSRAWLSSPRPAPYLSCDWLANT